MLATFACALAALATAHAAQTILASDPAFVTPLGRPYRTPTGLGLSWLGAGARVSHTGTTLRATFAPALRAFKVTFSQTNSNAMHYEGSAWVAGSNATETVTVAAASGTVDVLLNTPPQYFESALWNATLVSFTTDGTFNAAPAGPARRIHVLGDSITASTNIHGGTASCADEGLEADYSASWAGLLCLYLDASCSTIAVGGKCLLNECGGDQMQAYYRRARMVDSGSTYDFSSTPPPDAFAIYLGTNDARVNLWPQFTREALQFMGNVTTTYYPGANITFLLILGPMAPTAPSAALVSAVAEGTAAGLRVALVNASAACGESLSGCRDGCASHPGVGSHRAIAKAVAPVLEAMMGWPSPGSL